jgi:hypothetical protein
MKMFLKSSAVMLSVFVASSVAALENEKRGGVTGFNESHLADLAALSTPDLKIQGIDGQLIFSWSHSVPGRRRYVVDGQTWIGWVGESDGLVRMYRDLATERIVSTRESFDASKLSDRAKTEPGEELDPIIVNGSNVSDQGTGGIRSGGNPLPEPTPPSDPDPNSMESPERMLCLARVAQELTRAKASCDSIRPVPQAYMVCIAVVVARAAIQAAAC